MVGGGSEGVLASRKFYPSARQVVLWRIRRGEPMHSHEGMPRHDGDMGTQYWVLNAPAGLATQALPGSHGGQAPLTVPAASYGRHVESSAASRTESATAESATPPPSTTRPPHASRTTTMERAALRVFITLS